MESHTTQHQAIHLDHLDRHDHNHHSLHSSIPHSHTLPHSHAHAHAHSHSHNFALPSLSPTDYYSLDLQSAPATNIQPGPRSYKSRKYRPCDFCRARQVACKIDITPPCQLCSSHNHDCTFVERPKKKRRPNALNGEANGSGGPGVNGQASGRSIMRERDRKDSAHREDSVADRAWNADNLFENVSQISPGFISDYPAQPPFNGMIGDHGLDPQSSPNQLPQLHGGSPLYAIDPYMQIMPRIRPLDSHSTKSARFIGETGESNPYLLRHYRYNGNDECTISKLTYRRIKSNDNQDGLVGEKAEPPVVFMLADDSLATKGEPRVEDDVLQKCRTEVFEMFTEQEALRLIGLFIRFVYPYFPILSKSEICPNGVLSPNLLQFLPLSLLSAIYATALPFIIYDDLLATTVVHAPPPAHQLFRISWMCVTQELHTPRLATLQACLLLLQRAPTNRYTTDTPWKTSLVGWTVSLAQTLGLARECSDWSSLPGWEITLRRRLWFGVFVMDKWASLGAGMPSHIRSDDFDVSFLTDNDLEPPTPHPNANAIPAFLEPEADTSHFRLLADLTLILSDIMDHYYTLRAAQRTSKHYQLSLSLAKPLRKRLKDWNDSLPPALALRQPQERADPGSMARLSGNPSLSLAYMVTQITLFRALLRPLENMQGGVLEEEDRRTPGSRDAIRAVRQGAKECAKEVVEFAENLRQGALDAFWHSWSRANFAIASSFLVQLLVLCDTESESAEINGLVDRWRWAMRLGSGSAGNGFMSLGLLRLDGWVLENGQGQNGNPNQGSAGT
ncbi:fungal-specific transcription factor domain-containing protein [Amylocarpus encephaloides]|uniref:Fungal-specific transcription factor domain-containing protein n=1 Tax=Amylocarpus encephaloides TaxID=45428 RepID=A0A9P8C5S6_9HELO|nr:fungal-specific transcription factor domain-containing protein [Amylocarpus encephaloides]